MLLALARWIENVSPFSDLRGSSNGYPIVLALHLVAMALFGAMIVMTDLRLLGWAMRGRSISDVVNQLRVPKRIGFVLAVTCGASLFFSKAEEYYFNTFFRVKILLLLLVAVHAMIFRGSVYNRPEDLDAASEVPGRAKVAAGSSLLLWAGIMIAGRGIGYLRATGNTHYSQIFLFLHHLRGV
jgi:hypothetical protein